MFRVNLSVAIVAMTSNQTHIYPNGTTHVVSKLLVPDPAITNYSSGVGSGAGGFLIFGSGSGFFPACQRCG